MMLLLLTTFACAVKTILPAFLSWIVIHFCTKCNVEISLQEKEHEIKEQLASLSIVNEFAKYAKLQRQLNRIHEELSTRISLRQSKLMKTKLIISYSVHFIYACSILFLMWRYMSMPAVVINPKWVKPFDFIISWPTGIKGGIGLSVWLVMMESTIKTISSCFFPR